MEGVWGSITTKSTISQVIIEQRANPSGVHHPWMLSSAGASFFC